MPYAPRNGENKDEMGTFRSNKIFYAFMMGCLLGYTSSATAQGRSEEEKILESIRTGKVKITDEMIEAQRKQHPELQGKSNLEIKEKLEEAAKGRVEAPGMDESPAKEPDKAKTNRSSADGSPETASRFPNGLLRFGYDFFSNNTHAGVGAGSPALPEYILSPGDEIQIYTWGRDNQSQTSVIDNEGMFHYPPLQPMRLAGMKFAQAQEVLMREIQKINGVKASVGLGKLKSIRVFVLGEAVNPGSYVVPAGATVTSALFQSGGIREIGSLRGIQLKRNGKSIATLDLYEMLLKGNNRTDQQLVPGDVIFVPVAAIQVAVTGMVKRPGIYEVKPGMKVLEALDLAGGLSSNAFKGRVRLDRIESHRRKVVLDVGMEKMAGSSNAALLDGDILHVEEVLAKEFDVVYLEGNVNRPGRYEFKKGMTIRDLIPTIKDLKTETFFKYGHIKRSTDDDQGALLLPFSLLEVFENNAAVPLMPRDTVFIYSRFDIMDKPVVMVAGSVRRPGTYPFVDKMRISDLIIAGGGLTTGAYLPEAHLIRLLRVEESDSLYSILVKVNLTHLIDNPGDANNAELRPSDSLIFFPRSNFILPKSVTITGAVKKNGTFELTQNMGIPELVSQADGLTKTTYKLKAEVVRRVVEKDSVVRREIHRLSLKDILDGRQTFALQDGDAVYVRDVVDHQKSIVVTLTGEFNFPGRYEAEKGEKLSSMVRRAGGFTEVAYLRGAVFIRQRVKQQQLKAIDEVNRRLEEHSRNLLSQTTNEKDRATLQATIAQRADLLAEARTAPYLGRVVIEVPRDMEFDDPQKDLTMEDGDSLFVSSSPQTVSIMGEVFSPTSVIFSRENNSVNECLDKAGGVGEYGDKSNIYYMKPDGEVLTPRNTSFFGWRGVEAGGVIIVPPRGPKKDYLDALTKITQIIYQIAISVGVAKTVFAP